MNTVIQPHLERFVKSAARVRDLGEVFTPPATVDAMLDLMPDPVWEPHPSATFFEPACGDGNFLVAILQRKFDRLGVAYRTGTLPAGDDGDAVKFHALEALASIYAVDISADNVVGGTPGHEIGARARLITLFADNLEVLTGKRPGRTSAVAGCADWVVNRNVQVGNMLAFNADGTPSDRDQLPLVEYRWCPDTRSVTVAATTFGDVSAACRPSLAEQLSMFDTPRPSTVTWTGVYRELRSAPVAAPVTPLPVARNGTNRR